MKKSINKLSLVIILVFFSCKKNTTQETTTVLNVDTVTTAKKEILEPKNNNFASNISEFIPANYSVLDTTSGDLNLDEIKDYILVLKKNGEDTLSNVNGDPENRPLLILLGEGNNKLKLAKKNENTVYCFDCGGMMGDPFVGITIKNGYFSVEHYGGSSWRWSRIITYKYSKKDNEWFLHKDGSESFHASEPEVTESNIRTTKDFGQVKFEDFDIYKAY